MKASRGIGLVAGALVLLLALGAAWVAWMNRADDGEPARGAAATGSPPDAAAIARGEYLARAGNCIGCHTARGGVPYAGGRGVDTPFGTVYAPNLTPDRATGIGDWSSGDFWRALHHGRSRDGRLLYPAFPYPSFTVVTRDDADAIHAYLRSLPAVAQPNRPHELRFPYRLQAALAVWRALYFRPARFEADATQNAEWNRGRYLVQGLGHCIACHGERNALGATTGDIELGGGLIPMQNWYAPSLALPQEASVARWSEGEIVSLLKTGVSPHASVMGPMAEVVFRSTQHLSDADLRAMAVYLKALPQGRAAPPPAPRADLDTLRAGEKLYGRDCADCHGKQGEGHSGAAPPLAGNRAVTLLSPNNLIKSILHGGFAPTTAGNLQPHGMPPFGQSLNDAEIAALATYVRQSWGQSASAVSPLDVARAR